MKVVTDRAANWRLEVSCSECRSILEIDRADVRFEGRRVEDDDAPPPGVTPVVDETDGDFVATCAACNEVLVLDEDELPPFVRRDAFDAWRSVK